MATIGYIPLQLVILSLTPPNHPVHYPRLHQNQFTH